MQNLEEDPDPDFSKLTPDDLSQPGVDTGSSVSKPMDRRTGHCSVEGDTAAK